MQTGLADGFRTQGVCEHEHLIAGEFPRVRRVVSITGEGVLEAGAVLTYQSTSDTYVHGVIETEDDGVSDMGDAILAETLDLSSGQTQASVFFSGEFFASALVLAPEHSLAQLRAHFRTRSVFLHD